MKCSLQLVLVSHGLEEGDWLVSEEAVIEETERDARQMVLDLNHMIHNGDDDRSDVSEDHSVVQYIQTLEEEGVLCIDEAREKIKDVQKLLRSLTDVINDLGTDYSEHISMSLQLCHKIQKPLIEMRNTCERRKALKRKQSSLQDYFKR